MSTEAFHPVFRNSEQRYTFFLIKPNYLTRKKTKKPPDYRVLQPDSPNAKRLKTELIFSSLKLFLQSFNYFYPNYLLKYTKGR